MLPNVEYMMSIFIHKLRQLVNDNDPYAKIFLKNDGAPFQKGTIGTRVTAFIVKTGIRPDNLVSATDFRKWLVTVLKRKKAMGIPIDEDLLRWLMCHSDKTANEWYLRESLVEITADAAKLMDKHTKPSTPKRADEEDKHETPESDHESANPKSPQLSTSSQRSLNKDQKERIASFFAEDIKHGIQPRKKRIIALMKDDSVLRKLVNSAPHVKKVTDRVRMSFENREMVNPYDLPDDNSVKRMASYVLSAKVPSVSSFESGRCEWKEEETDAIIAVLKGKNKCPTTNEIRSLFARTPFLQVVFKANTFIRIQNKVKNEFRKLKMKNK